MNLIGDLCLFGGIRNMLFSEYSLHLFGFYSLQSRLERDTVYVASYVKQEIGENYE